VFAYRRSKVVSNFMSKCHVADDRWHVLSVIKQSDDSSVQTLQTSAVMLFDGRRAQLAEIIFGVLLAKRWMKSRHEPG
jgi:hypothetical protein